jgi:hypothetical protein
MTASYQQTNSGQLALYDPNAYMMNNNFMPGQPSTLMDVPTGMQTQH